jgi:retron-type reverse transcriptase
MYNQLYSWDNLYLAYRRAAKGKRGHPNVAEFEYRLEGNLLDLQQDLEAFTYHPGTYTSFYIHEPKRRLISAAPFRDRVVHHALCNLIEPLFEGLFIPDSYANRVGKGTHRALDRLQTCARRYPFALQCDIRQFFPSIDHAILKAEIVQRIRDIGVMWLVDRILESGSGVLDEVYEMVYFPGDDLFARERTRGLPIGNLTSQFWGNVYLNPFDHFVKRELGCRAYLRYVDDFVLFADDKDTLWAWKQAIEHRLARLRLAIHPGAHPRPGSEGIPFLGFVIYPQKRRLKRRKGIGYRRKLRSLLQAHQRGEISLEEVTASIQGWVNHAQYGNTVGLRKAILGAQQPINPPQPEPGRAPLHRSGGAAASGGQSSRRRAGSPPRR